MSQPPLLPEGTAPLDAERVLVVVLNLAAEVHELAARVRALEGVADDDEEAAQREVDAFVARTLSPLHTP